MPIEESASATHRESEEVLEGRRKRRLAAIWVLAGVVVAGNLAGWFGFIKWGPAQSDKSHLIEVHASAFMFWVAVGMLLLCVRDLFSMQRHGGSAPPTYEDLPDKPSNRLRKPANAIRKWMSKNQAIVGAAGLIAGILLGHRFWTV